MGGRSLMGWAAVVGAGAIAGTAALLGGGDEPATSEDDPPAQVRRVAERVEGVRGERFEHVPRVRLITKDQLARRLRREQARQSARATAAEKASIEALALMGLVPRGAEDELTDADDAAADILGLYDDQTRELYVIEDAPGGPAQRELTIAHELTHALDDQRFDLDDPRIDAGDDEAAARPALAEGSATDVELRYAARHLRGARPRRPHAIPASQRRADYVGSSELFRYLDGARFVAALRRRGGEQAVNRALRGHEPRSTEQVLHPDKYFAQEEPVRVRADLAGVFGDGWREAVTGTLGEFDTGQLLLYGANAARSVDRARANRAAAGWGGGRYWMLRGPDQGQAVVLSWAWDSVKDRREFDAALPAYVEGHLDLRPAGGAAWRDGSLSAARASVGRRTALVLAPDPRLAAKAAAAAVRPSEGSSR
ncbi:MAG: hypothetical protein HZB46_05620 [Solirubrobacterales bacterium]|nr:hypothetical protein [Solirubrobacterales bacterium]